ncbi:hypothetical protein [Polycladidibacter stylochi]|uniref:hypothetical protein n=1 Tax=Polycladidibacter stylochi TaxID=1807766 RepID=UPI00082DB02C|nr:hypothetical protein [Pseudovibrio stylochi]
MESLNFHYPKLAELVKGKDVYVLSHGADNSIAPDDAIIVRFNRSYEQCDIWVSAFLDREFKGIDLDHLLKAHLDTPLVMSSIPLTNEGFYFPYCQGKVVPNYLERLSQTWNIKNFEPITLNHYMYLSMAMPYWPYAGLSFLAMLQAVEFKSCHIYGFDFYSETTESGSLRPINEVHPTVSPCFENLNYIDYKPDGHDLPAAINWAQGLIAEDKRFIWKSRDLEEVKRIFMPSVILGDTRFLINNTSFTITEEIADAK